MHKFIDALQFEDLFDRVIYLKNGIPSEEVNKEILKRNANTTAHYPNSLGSGAFATVYENEIDSSRVYKVGNANSNCGYLTYFRTIRNQEKPNIHFPHIFGAELYINKATGAASFLIEMELLLPHYEVTDGSDCLPEKYQKMSYYTWHRHISRHITHCERYGDKVLNLSVQMPESYNEAVKILRDAKESRGQSTMWDVNMSNIMFRRESLDMVITDPLT